MTTKQEIISLLTELIAIDSANSWLTPDGPGERNVQEYMKSYLEGLGIPSTFEQIDETHWNLTAVIKGAGGGEALSLYAHADTVGYELWPGRALRAELAADGDRLVGLGAADDKGHCAAILLVAKTMQERIAQGGPRPKGDVRLLFAADEEGTSVGAFDYVKHHEPAAMLVLESAPRGDINICHQGFGWLRIRVEGKAGHGSAGGAAQDAITRMAEVIVRLERNRREKFAPNPHPLNGETVYHTGLIRGGTDFASYPDYCELGIEIGTQPGETLADRVREIEAIFTEVRRLYPDLEASVEKVIERGPFETKNTEALLAALNRAVAQVAGIEAQGVGENAWGDAQIFQDAGFPTLGIGAVGDHFHAPEEWVSVSALAELVEILLVTIADYCG